MQQAANDAKVTGAGISQLDFWRNDSVHFMFELWKTTDHIAQNIVSYEYSMYQDIIVYFLLQIGCSTQKHPFTA